MQEVTKSTLVSATKDSSEADLNHKPERTLGEYAYAVIAEQYQQVIRQEKKVLADKGPEPVHQMRVGTRRLRTALQVFGRSITLPKEAQEKQISNLTHVLGELRDLDVQTSELTHTYRPRLNSMEQTLLDKAAKTLHRHRRKAFAKTEATLTRSRYQDLKAAYEQWLEQPQYTPIAQLPLLSLIPDLLHPLLSQVLLHPGWLSHADNSSESSNNALHDLRKVCKQVRYQAEFFACFYGEAFQNWVEEIKTIQSQLGQLHDSQVLSDLLKNELSKHSELPEFQAVLKQVQAEAMADWETIRHQYLNPSFRQQLHQIILKPTLSVSV